MKNPKSGKKTMTKTKTEYFQDPRLSAAIVLVLGTGVTIGANILHATSNPWAKALSASVPLVLFFAAHTAAYAKSALVRALMIPVSVITFAISYDHMNSLAMRYSESYAVAKFYPLAIDGAMLVATVALAAFRPDSTPEPVADVEHDEVLSLLSDAEFMALTWPDGALELISEDERVPTVRRLVNKHRKENGQPAINQNTAQRLIRNYTQEHAS
jgi:uncharacterized protein DUF2637